MNDKDKKKTEGQYNITDKQKKIKQSFDKLENQNGKALKRLSDN